MGEGVTRYTFMIHGFSQLINSELKTTDMRLKALQIAERIYQELRPAPVDKKKKQSYLDPIEEYQGEKRLTYICTFIFVLDMYLGDREAAVKSYIKRSVHQKVSERYNSVLENIYYHDSDGVELWLKTYEIAVIKKISVDSNSEAVYLYIKAHEAFPEQYRMNGSGIMFIGRG